MFGTCHYQIGLRGVGGRRLRAALLASTALVAAGASAVAQDATWIGTGNPSNFADASNWSPASTPSVTAFFDVAAGTNIQNNSITSIGGWTFNPGASNYHITNYYELNFTGAGIVVDGGSVSLGNTLASMTFQNHSSAGSATIVNTHGSLSFQDTSTAGSATVTNTSGTLTFQGASTAGNAAIANSDSFFFTGSSTAGNATLTNNQNFISFNGNSTAGNATIVNNTNAVVNFTNTTGLAGDNRISAGSIAGAGVYVLGANELTVGANNSSTTVSGEIRGTGSLVKNGTGTLTLTGYNTYSGGTTVNNGTVQLGDAGNTSALLGPAAVGASGTLNFVNVDTSGMTAITNGGAVNFMNGSSAAGAVIGNTGTLKFKDSSTAAIATITNDGSLEFSSSSTAQSAHITNNSTASFLGSSTASGSVITNNASLNFRGGSTAGSGAITNNASLAFHDNSTGGSSAITNNVSGTVDFSTSTGAAGDNKVAAGSIAGAGNYILGANQLTVGGNNQSTEVSGVISGSGPLVKTGSGTLTLSGTNTYSGGTTINNGTLQLGTGGSTATIQGAITLSTGQANLIVVNTGALTSISNAGSITFATGTNAGNVTIANNFLVYFNGTSSAGSATITNVHAATEFYGTSTAASATIANNSGRTSFYANTTAGGATITNDSQSILYFRDSGSAGTATITNGGGIFFRESSTAGSATITNDNQIYFENASTAGSATIINNSIVQFAGSSTAGDATITNKGLMIFSDISNASNAAITNTPNGFSAVIFDSAGAAGDNKLSAGSIAGVGTYSLGTNELTVGGNNRSTTVSGIIDGVGGSLVKTGTGTMTLSGVNTYTGGTTINGGTVSVGGNANLGDAAGALTFNGGTLQVTGTSFHSTARAINWGAAGGGFDIAAAANTFTVGQSLGGAGGLNKLGAGMLVLSGNNTYSGGTTLSGRAVSVGSDANLGNAAGALNFNGGTLRVTGTSFHSTARTINWGAAGGGFGIADAANSFTVGQSLGGAGGLTKSGAGTLVLTSTNSYAGGTTINDGALQLGNSGVTGKIVGAVAVVGATAAFNVVNADTSGITSITNGGLLSFAGSSSAASAIVTNNNVLRFNDASTAANATIGNNGYLYFTGTATAGSAIVTNNGSLEFQNSATAGNAVLTNLGFMRFDGTSTADNATIASNGNGALYFTGTATAGSATVTANAGATTAFSDASSGGSARFITNAGGMFDISRLTAAAMAAGSIEGAGHHFLGARQLTVGGTNLSTTVSGSIADGGAAGGTGGSLVKTGTGTLTLSGLNIYTGGTTINGGTLQLGDGGVTGSILGAVAVAGGGTFNVVNAGTGGITSISNAGVIDFRNGTSAGAAGVTNTGNLNFRNSSTAGGAAITNISNLDFLDTSTGGSAVITNNSALRFFNSATADIATIINNATLSFQDMSTAAAAALFNNASGLVDFSGSTGPAGDRKLSAGSIAGAGNYILGNNELTVGGNNLSTAVSGIISGAGGSLVKTGTGATMLSGVSTYTGATTVNAGTLAVNGSILSSSGVTVNAGGTLGGTGHVGNTTIMSGGNLAAGNSIGTLTVNGNLSFNAGATYTVEVSPSAADRTNVVGGTATLSGANVQALPLAGSFRSQTYTILNASGGFAGTQFASLNVTGRFSPARNPHLTYDLNNVYLVLDPGEIILPSGTRGSQASVATGINRSVLGGTIPPAGFGVLLNLDGALLKTALTQISGETAVGAQQGTFNAMTMFLGQLTDPFTAGRSETAATAADGAFSFGADDAGATRRDGTAREGFAAIARATPSRSFEQRWSVWSGGYGGAQTTDGNLVTGTGTANSRVYGGIGGADYRVSQDMRVGFALAGGGTSFSVANGGSGRSDMFQAGAFARYDPGAFYLAVALAYGWQDVTTDRTVTIAGIDRLRAQFDANAFSGRAESGYRFVAPVMGGVGITPYAAGQFTAFDLPAYAEHVVSGANTFALAYNSKSVTATRSELGFRADKSFAMQSAILTLRGRAAWAHDFNPDRAVAATFQALPGASFVVDGARQASDAALTTASAEVRWINGWSATGTFEGEFSNITRSYAGKGVVRYAW